MVGRNYSKTLVEYVDDVLEEYDAGVFHDYWKLSRHVINELPIRKFYAHLGQSNPGAFGRIDYLNVTFVSDNLVADIEGTIRRSNEIYVSNDQGGFVVTPLRSIEAIEFHNGRISTIRESSDAKLILIASILGDSTMGKYWIANTDDEYDHLVQFGKALMEATTKA